jgi:hypothetical protein
MLVRGGQCQTVEVSQVSSNMTENTCNFLQHTPRSPQMRHHKKRQCELLVSDDLLDISPTSDTFVPVKARCAAISSRCRRRSLSPSEAGKLAGTFPHLRCHGGRTPPSSPEQIARMCPKEAYPGVGGPYGVHRVGRPMQAALGAIRARFGGARAGRAHGYPAALRPRGESQRRGAPWQGPHLGPAAPTVPTHPPLRRGTYG